MLDVHSRTVAILLSFHVRVFAGNLPSRKVTSILGEVP